MVLPTYNERETIEVLLTRLLEALEGTDVEVIVVDDSSPDGTGELVQWLVSADPRVRLRTRAGKLGLAGAVFDGVAESQGAYVCVMDADLSHDPAHVPGMLAKAQEGFDLVIGSRYVAGAAIENWPFLRRVVSRVITVAARALLRLPARDILSGFVVCRRAVLEEMSTRFSARGFKFLVEVMATHPRLLIYEWPITFRDRMGGRSKAGAREGIELARLCLRLLGWKAARRLRRLRGSPR